MLDFNLLLKSKLHQKGELTVLLGVTRLMVGRYINEGSIPRGVNRDRAKKVLSVIKDALDAGELPLSVDADDAARKKLVAQFLKRVNTI